MQKALSIIKTSGLMIALVPGITPAADVPNPTHYAIHGESLIFAANATDTNSLHRRGLQCGIMGRGELFPPGKRPIRHREDTDKG